MTGETTVTHVLRQWWWHVWPH